MGGLGWPPPSRVAWVCDAAGCPAPPLACSRCVGVHRSLQRLVQGCKAFLFLLWQTVINTCSGKTRALAVKSTQNLKQMIQDEESCLCWGGPCCHGRACHNMPPGCCKPVCVCSRVRSGITQEATPAGGSLRVATALGLNADWPLHHPLHLALCSAYCVCCRPLSHTGSAAAMERTGNALKCGPVCRCILDSHQQPPIGSDI